MGERSPEVPDSDAVKVGTNCASYPSKLAADAEGGIDGLKDEITVVAKAAMERE
jgi:hypothetical protein